ncbi:MAG: hypothetical protein EBY57_01135 [Actinobacteria bacterium]|nr:hypothetical protein [Actinomycetota bacterium]
MGPDDLRALRRTVVALGYEQNEPEARSFLRHEDSVVRELALVLALAPFSGPEIEAAIDTALTDRDWQVRQSAEDLRR